MATTALMTEQEYRELALNDAEHRWELWDGVPVEKPWMSMQHDDVGSYLGHLLQSQLDHGSYQVHVNSARARISARNFFVPDVAVIPAELVVPLKHDLRAFDAFSVPLPLVVEIWSPSTGAYDVARKLDGYRGRGDLEIWDTHHSDRILTAWRRQADGTYTETIYRGGIVPAESLPGVSIDLDALLDG